MTTDDERLQWETVHAVADYLTRIDSSNDSMMVAETVHQMIKDTLGNPDPYFDVKEEYTEIAERMESLIGELASQGDDPLLTAIKIAIAGNIIDFGAGSGFDVEKAIRGSLDFALAVNHYEAFRETLDKAGTILYLCDNTGEIYFDKPLLKLLAGRDVTICVRGGPILNDATREYAERAGLHEFGTLIDTGILSPGFPIDRVQAGARDLFYGSDMVISKGQANFETLNNVVRPGFFLLMKVKCDLVARILGTRYGDIVLMESGRIPMNDD